MRKKVRKVKKIFAGLLSAMLALSAVNVSGWGVMNAKAEETVTASTTNLNESV